MMGFDTRRLHIRPLAEADESLYCGLYTDAETMRFIGPPMSQVSAARSFQSALRLTRRQPLTQIFLTVACKTSLQSVGICTVQEIDAAQRRAEAGIIIESTARAHGFAREALSALVTRAFEVLPIDTVRVRIAADHAIVERAGDQRRLSAGRRGCARTRTVGPAHLVSFSPVMAATSDNPVTRRRRC